MKKIFYIEKHIRIFQTCEKLSKIVKFFKNLSKKSKNVIHFSEEKNDLFKNKIHQKINVFAIVFFFKLSIFLQFIFNYRLLFFFNEIQLTKQLLLFNENFF